MKVLIAGATGALGMPLVRTLKASGHEVIGITRTPGKSSRLEGLGAQPIVADVMDREGLLRAVNGRQADVVVHVLTALPKNGPLRHRDMYQTDALRDVGTTHLLAAAREVGARKIVVESMHVGYGSLLPIGETSIRASNALARTELGWVPSVPTYREGVQKIAQAFREMPE